MNGKLPGVSALGEPHIMASLGLAPKRAGMSPASLRTRLTPLQRHAAALLMQELSKLIQSRRSNTLESKHFSSWKGSSARDVLLDQTKEIKKIDNARPLHTRQSVGN